MCFVNLVVVPWMIGTMLEPTVHPFSRFNVSQDAANLREAMQGWGTNEQAIIDILTHRSNEQRQAITKFFNRKFKRDLIEDLKIELSGLFEEVVLAMMTPPMNYLAQQLHTAMDGPGTAENTLVEILCTTSKPDVQRIADVYERLYGRSLVEDIGTETSGELRRLLILIVTDAGKPRPPPNAEVAVKLANMLIAAGERRPGTDESVFNKILAHESFAQLRGIFQEYKRLSGNTIEQALRNEMSGDALDAMLAIVKTVQCPSEFFAKRLHDAMAGSGTDDTALIRIIVRRSEIDLEAIKNEYERIYDKTLKSAVIGDTSGDYEKALLALIDP